MRSVPRNTCGYEHRGGWGKPHSCLRETWRGHDRCIWHATGADDEVLEKPVAELERARRSDPSRPADGEYLDGASLRGVSLDDISFDGCSLIGADFARTGLQWETAPIDLPWAAYLAEDDTFEESRLPAPSFRNADLRASTFEACNIPWSDFTGADLRGANLEEVGFAYSCLCDANLRAADCKKGYFGRARLDRASVLNTDFTDAVLSKADLPRVRAERANFTRTDLTDADLSNAELFAAVFLDAKIGPRTQFGDRCLYDPANELEPPSVAETDVEVHRIETDDPVEREHVKALWTYRRLGELHRQNALTSKARQYYLRRKSVRRRYARAGIREDWAAFREAIARLRTILLPTSTPLSAAETDPDSRSDTRHDSESTDTGSAEDPGSEPGDGTQSVGRITGADRTTERPDIVLTKGFGPWLYYVLFDEVMRYGDSPKRVVGTSGAAIFTCAVLYPIFGLHRGSEEPILSYATAGTSGAPGFFETIGHGLYFSVVTFTTLGYGDIQPVGFAKALSMGESLLGGLLMALLVFVLGRRATL